MKAIKIHGMSPDNSGDFREAGTELTIGDEAKAGVISKAKADQLIKNNAASPLAEKAKAKAAD